MKRMKKLLAMALSAALLVTCMPALTAHADLGGWTTAANGVMTITGTSVTVRYANNTIYIEGSGAIPDYTPETYTMRPWHYYDFDYVSIGDGITQIGSYAFADMTNIKQITMPATTFITDGTAFLGLSDDTILRVTGSVGTTRQYGNLNYSSLDSIAANAPGSSQCIFIMDSDLAAQHFRELSYPYLKYVYSATDTSAPWLTKKDMTTDITFNKVCTISSANDMGIFTNMYAAVSSQGAAYMACIGYLMGDEYTYVRSYNMALIDDSEIVYGTNGLKKYVLHLQPKEQIATRQYSLIEMGPDGQWYYLEDLDSDCTTVTFATNYPTSTYSLVFKYDTTATSGMTTLTIQ